MKKIFFLFMISSIIFSNESIIINGYVLDEETGNPVSKVEIIALSENELLTTLQTDKVIGAYNMCTYKMLHKK